MVAMVEATSASSTGVETTTPTPARRCVPATVIAHDAAGVLAPRSVMVKPRPRSGSATSAVASPCGSPMGAPSTMVPRVVPRRGEKRRGGGGGGRGGGKKGPGPAGEPIHHDGRPVLVADVDASRFPVVTDE